MITIPIAFICPIYAFMHDLIITMYSYIYPTLVFTFVFLS